jgi:serine/threonine-protein kinase
MSATRSVLRGEPDWAALPPAVPPLIGIVIRGCLEKDPRRRMRDIGDARLLLRDAQDMAAEPPVQVPRRATVPWSLLAVVVLIASALGAGLWRATRPADRPLIWLSVDLGPDARASRDLTAAISPDGTRLVFPMGEPSASRLAVRSLGQPNATPLAGPKADRTPSSRPMANGSHSAPAAS